MLKLCVNTKLLLILVTLIVLTGCATQPPEPIRENIAANPTIGQVQQNIAQYKDSRVRWGGEIFSISNLASHTKLEIISRPLNESAKPQPVDASNGRFIAVFKGFLEPASFAKGRYVTVIGNVTELESSKIGSYEYQYPVVLVDSFYLWPQEQYMYAPYPRHYDPFFYDPWYPWYPWWYY